MGQDRNFNNLNTPLESTGEITDIIPSKLLGDIADAAMLDEIDTSIYGDIIFTGLSNLFAGQSGTLGYLDSIRKGSFSRDGTYDYGIEVNGQIIQISIPILTQQQRHTRSLAEHFGGFNGLVKKSLGNLGLESLAGLMHVLQRPFLEEAIDNEVDRDILNMIQNDEIVLVLIHHIAEVVSDIIEAGELHERVADMAGEQFANQFLAAKQELFVGFCTAAIEMRSAENLADIDRLLAKAESEFNDLFAENSIFSILSETLWLNITDSNNIANFVSNSITYAHNQCISLGDLEAAEYLRPLEDGFKYFLKDLLVLNIRAVADIYRYCIQNPENEYLQIASEYLERRYLSQLRRLELENGYHDMSISQAAHNRADEILTGVTMSMVTSGSITTESAGELSLRNFREAVEANNYINGLVNDLGPQIAETRIGPEQIYADLLDMYEIFTGFIQDNQGESTPNLAKSLEFAYQMGAHRGIEISNVGLDNSQDIVSRLEELGMVQDANYANRFMFVKTPTLKDAQEIYKFVHSMEGVLNMANLQLDEFVYLATQGFFNCKQWIPYYTLMKDCAQFEENTAFNKYLQQIEGMSIDDQLIYLIERIESLQQIYMSKVEKLLQMYSNQPQSPELRMMINFTLYDLIHYGLAADYDDMESKAEQVVDLILNKQIDIEDLSEISDLVEHLSQLNRQLET